MRDLACPRKESPDHTSCLASAPARPAATAAGCPGGSVEQRCLPTAADLVSSQTGKMVPMCSKRAATSISFLQRMAIICHFML